jgi:hypothetical protein
MFKWFRPFFWGLLFTIALYATDAYASSETNQYPNRGEGAAGISGYVVSNLHFRLAEDPSYLNAVELDLDSPASQVVIEFDTASKQSFTCHNVDRQHWICEVENVEIAEINLIQVVSIE